MRSLALTGCVIASLATPTLAGAMQVKPDIQPTAGAHYEGSVLVGGDQSAKVPAAPPPATTKPAPTTAVVHQVHSSDSDRTLAIVLASAALGIALCGSAYAVIRVTRMQRRVLSSN